MKKISLVLCSLLLGLSLAPAHAAAVAPGAPCSKLNAKVTVASKVLNCSKSGSKLIWKIQAAASSSKPTPSAVAATSPTPAPSPTPTPSTSPSPAPVIVPAQWRDLTADQVISESTKAINDYLAIKRSPSAVVDVVAQDGVDPTLKVWVQKGATLVAQSFAYPPLTSTFYDVIALDRGWLTDTYTKLGFTPQQVKDRQGGFDAGAPAFGGSQTNTWNMTSIIKNNLMNRDRTGTAQTSGHEFFHAVQERYVGRNPGPKGEEIPNWFWEGPAMFVGLHAADQVGSVSFAQEGRKSMLDRFNNGPAQTKTLLLKDVKANDGITDPYGIGFAATEYLVAQVGVEKFLNIYAELGKGKNFSDAFLSATGLGLDDFYSHFEGARTALGFPKA